MEKLLTAHDVAAKLQCHVQTVYRNKELPRIKILGVGVRYLESRIEEDIEARTKKSNLNTLELIDNQHLKLNKSSICDIIHSTEIGGKSEMAKAKPKSRYNFGYGAIYQRKTKKGKIRWYLDYQVGGRRIQKVVPLATSKEEAHVAFQEEISKIFRKEYGIQEDKKHVRFDRFSEHYLKNYSMVKKRAWKRSDKVYINANLNPFFGQFELGQLDVELIEKFVAKRLDDEVEKSTINRDISCLKKMLNKAVDWEYLSTNPALKIKQFSENDNFRSRVLTVEEEKVLLDNCVDHVKSMVILSLHTGMRKGEILDLRWEQVDLQNKQIRVEKTKSGKIRYIPMNHDLYLILKRLHIKDSHGPFVFLNPRSGKPFTTIKTAFNAACRRAKLQDFRFHDLRRTFATRILQRGADIETVRELLGHHSVVVTQRYTHSNVEAKRSAVDLLIKKKSKTDQKEPILLHNCDMAQEKQSEKIVSLSISAN